MPKMFFVYLGGITPKANIELHNVQFVAMPQARWTSPRPARER
jgi:hypothetical protein